MATGSRHRLPLGSFGTWMRSASAPATPASQDEALLFFHIVSLCAQLRATHFQDLTIEPDAKQVTDAASTLMTTMHWESLIGALPSVQSLRLHRDGTL
jgi:hypothetical protein